MCEREREKEEKKQNKKSNLLHRLRRLGSTKNTSAQSVSQFIIRAFTVDTGMSFTQFIVAPLAHTTSVTKGNCADRVPPLPVGRSQPTASRVAVQSPRCSAFSVHRGGESERVRGHPPLGAIGRVYAQSVSLCAVHGQTSLYSSFLRRQVIFLLSVVFQFFAVAFHLLLPSEQVFLKDSH